MNYLKISIGTALLAMCMFGTAQASLIKGQLDFVGSATVVRDGGKYVSIDYDDGVDAPVVWKATGDYASIDKYTAVEVIDPLTFSSLSLPETIWKIVSLSNTFSFSLQSININDGTTVGGKGIISATGFDNTNGYWSLTSQGSSSGQFSFSSTTFATPIPAAIWLFGTALLGLVGFSKRKSRIAA